MIPSEHKWRDGQTDRKSLIRAMGNMLSDGFSVYDVTAETEEAFVELHLFACHGVHNCGLKKSYKLCSIRGCP